MIEGGFPHLAEIKQSIALVHRRLDVSVLRNFTPGVHQSLAVPKLWKDRILEVQELARAIANHYRLNVRMIVVSVEPRLKSAGAVELHSGDEFFVSVRADVIDRPQEVAAILAHEVTHIFLHKYGIDFPDEYHDEILTDTTGAYLGVGALLLNGFTKEHRRIDATTTESAVRHYGYITPDELGYILWKRATMFGETPKAFQLSPYGRAALLEGKRRARRDFREPPLSRASFWSLVLYRHRRARFTAAHRGTQDFDVERRFDHYTFTKRGNDTYVVFPCPHCGQYLRLIGLTSKQTMSRCPVCKAECKIAS